jgi:small subunit ribosomal protein S17
LIKNIGIPGVKPPEKECNDAKCPYHGTLKLRGRILTGKVVSTKMNKTITIQRDYAYYITKYQRYERRNSKLSAHLPGCIEVSAGDIVKVAECRKLSKTVAFVVVDILKSENL